MQTEIDVTGVNAITFPEMITWEWPVAAYLFLGGLVAGLMILGASLKRFDVFRRAVRIADFSALPLLALGLLMLWVDLANRWNAWRFFTTFQLTSAMSWGSWILLLSTVVLAVRAARRLPDDAGGWIGRLATVGRLARRLDGVYLEIATVVLGVGLGFYTGVLLSTIAARPLWNTAVLAPLFLVSGVASAGAFLCVFIGREAHEKLVPLSLATCGAEALLIGAYLAALYFGPLAMQESLDVLTGGIFGLVFWVVVLGLGVVVPAAIESYDMLRKQVPELLGRAAPIFKLSGSAALRFVVLFAGLQTVL